jgi:hypothetical protein
LNSIDGAGVLIVTGQLTILNNAGYNGVIICIGQGALLRSGGNSGNVQGAILVAKTRDASNNLLTTLGNPAYNAIGGGNATTYQKTWRQFF